MKNETKVDKELLKEIADVKKRIDNLYVGMGGDLEDLEEEAHDLFGDDFVSIIWGGLYLAIVIFFAFWGFGLFEENAISWMWKTIIILFTYGSCILVVGLIKLWRKK